MLNKLAQNLALGFLIILCACTAKSPAIPYQQQPVVEAVPAQPEDPVSRENIFANGPLNLDLDLGISNLTLPLRFFSEGDVEVLSYPVSFESKGYIIKSKQYTRAMGEELFQLDLSRADCERVDLYAQKYNEALAKNKIDIAQNYLELIVDSHEYTIEFNLLPFVAQNADFTSAVKNLFKSKYPQTKNLNTVSIRNPLKVQSYSIQIKNIDESLSKKLATKDSKQEWYRYITLSGLQAGKITFATTRLDLLCDLSQRKSEIEVFVLGHTGVDEYKATIGLRM